MKRRIAYFDCFSGVSGDMALGALVDCGLEKKRLQKIVAGLKLGRVDLKISRTRRGGIAGTKVDVVPRWKAVEPRGLRDVAKIIEKSSLGEAAASKCLAAFKALATAEARVHGVPVEKIHFHELGAVDTIVDIAGAVAGLEALGVDEVFCSAVTVGRGVAKCAHGAIPLPAPAAMELLRGVPVREADEEREMTTPTGAALMKTLSSRFGPMPPMVVSKVGYGAGAHDSKVEGARPNLLRLVIGEAVAREGADEVVVLSANIDNVTPEICGYAIERFLAEGALDAWAAPIVMKKGRPAWALSAMCAPDAAGRMEDIFFRETGTLGVRLERLGRAKMERKIEKVRTRWGVVRLKVGLCGGEFVKASPEYEDCRALAEKHGVALRDVYEEALLRRARKNR